MINNSIAKQARITSPPSFDFLFHRLIAVFSFPLLLVCENGSICAQTVRNREKRNTLVVCAVFELGARLDARLPSTDRHSF